MKTPNKTEAAYWAGKEIRTRGPMHGEALYDLVDFGQRRATSLKRIVDSGWLVQLEDGRIDLGQQARDFYAGVNVGLPAKEMGSLATPRENVHAFRPLSARHRLNPRGTRPDAMDNSLRAMPSHYSKVTP